LKEAAIPHTCRARPVQGGGRKGKGKAREVDAPIFPHDTCIEDDEVLVLLCFCCPMMQFVDYKQLYMGKNFVSADAPKLADGKDIIQLHSEFTIRKNNGEEFTRRDQRDFPEGFHSDEDLAVLILRTAAANGNGLTGFSYLGESPVKDHWLDHMGDDLENVSAKQLIMEADELIEGWTKVSSSKSLAATPTPTLQPLAPPTTPPLGLTEYSWMLGGKCIPLGFAAQPLNRPSGEVDADVPSETAPNA
jgi:hypothetical protein